MRISCEELLAVLSKYLNGELLADSYVEFAEHVKGCDPCRIVVDNLHQTIKLYKSEQEYPLAPELQQKLQLALRDR